MNKKILFSLLVTFIFWTLSDLVLTQLKKYSETKSNQKWTQLETSYRTSSPEFLLTLKPNINLDTQWANIPYRIITNNLGFKDNTNRMVELSSNSYRILFLGDSFTEGVGYNHEKTFVGITGSNLNKYNVEVLNAGMMRCFPSIYYLKAKFFIEQVKLKVNHLFVTIDISDIHDEYDNQRGQLIKQNKDIESTEYKFSEDDLLDNRSLTLKIKYFLLNHLNFSYNLYDLIRTNISGKKLANMNQIDWNKAKWTFDDFQMEKFGSQGLKLATEQLNNIYKLALKYNLKLTLMVYPWPTQIFYEDNVRRQVTHWTEWSKNKNVDIIDLHPFFMNIPKQESIQKYFIPGDQHWSEEGNSLVGEIVSQYFKSLLTH